MSTTAVYDLEAKTVTMSILELQMSYVHNRIVCRRLGVHWIRCDIQGGDVRLRLVAPPVNSRRNPHAAARFSLAFGLPNGYVDATRVAIQ